jgi:alpha-L-fucosidase 2
MKYLLPLIITVVLLSPVWKASAQSALEWKEKGKDYHDAIPLGNGDIGVSAWMEQQGDLLFYISKTDAYDDNNRLLKLGKIRVSFSPGAFAGKQEFHQVLNLKAGEMEWQAGSGKDRVNLLLWVDANHPAIHLSLLAKKKISMQVKLENWRWRERTVTADRAFSDPYPAVDDSNAVYVPTIQYPDSLMSNPAQGLVWFHHNAHSCWPYTLSLQGLGEWMKGQSDPLLNRIFGAAISGQGLQRQNDTTLISSRPETRQELLIVVLTKKNVDAAAWLKSLAATQTGIRQLDPYGDKAAHEAWWEAFWNRSYIRIETANDTGKRVTQGYDLQRYLMACGGRGGAWTKFNGSIFTLPWKNDADYRDWGSANWFQNARLLYWPMIASGDFDMMAPFYGNYLAALPLAKERTHLYYGHDGAFFPETSYAWGTYANFDYGYDRAGMPRGAVRSTYMRHYWSGGLELCAMMLEQYRVTQNKSFLTDTLLPLAVEIVRFYGEHWKNRDENGKIIFDTTQALETWQATTNPTPIIAGLKYVLHGLLNIPDVLTSADQRDEWKKILDLLPAIPERKVQDKMVIAPAAVFGNLSNVENPELYAVFPYKVFGIGKDSLEKGLQTFAIRQNRQNRCWWQDEIHAACLGLGREAANGIARRMTDWNKDYRFPAMWGPNNDEIPDLDHGGSGDMAMQQMLLQDEGAKLFLFPAWPRSWNVFFKLHAAGGTVIEGALRAGRLEKLLVEPESRRKDIIIMPLQ